MPIDRIKSFGVTRAEATRAELRELATAAANAHPVTVAPTVIHVVCRQCAHQTTIKVMLRGRKLKLRCTRCGHPDPIVSGLEDMRRWARRRIGK